jgi:NADPH:quinone reductase-like Zn-dependent oxidoreductase
MAEVTALVAHDAEHGVLLRQELLDDTALPDGDVTIAVEYSSVNFKDGLAVTAGGGVARSYPLIPGIDVAGTVSSTSSPDFAVGDAVVAHGYDIGTGRAGGYSDTARYPADMVVKLDTLTTAQAAAIGTAWLHCGDERRSASGARHHTTTARFSSRARAASAASASTCWPRRIPGGGIDRQEDARLLGQLGAAEVVGRLPEEGERVRALGKAKWAAVVDCVGGQTLAYALSTLSTSEWRRFPDWPAARTCRRRCTCSSCAAQPRASTPFRCPSPNARSGRGSAVT